MIQRDHAYTKHEIADALDVSVKTVERHWLDYGVHIGGTWLISGRILLRLIERKYYDDKGDEEES